MSFIKFDNPYNQEKEEIKDKEISVKRIGDVKTTMAIGEEGGGFYETMNTRFFDLLKNNLAQNHPAENPKEQKFNFFRDYIIANLHQWKQKEKEDLCVNAIIPDNDNQDISNIVNTYCDNSQEIL